MSEESDFGKQKRNEGKTLEMRLGTERNQREIKKETKRDERNK